MKNLLLFLVSILFISSSCGFDDDDDKMPSIVFTSTEDVFFTPGETIDFTIETKEDLTRYNLFIGADQCTTNVYKLHKVSNSEYKLELTIPKHYKKLGGILHFRNNENIIVSSGPTLKLYIEPETTPET